MDIVLENERIKVGVKSKGAELYSLINKETGLEYMWSGDAAVWGKTSPVLFPIVGTLKNNAYVYDKVEYNLTRHGFARDAGFEAAQQSKNKATFILKDTSSSFKNYPFNFHLEMIYELDEACLKVSYEVKNTGNYKMYFSLGAHPAFKVPLTEGSSYDNYYLQFETTETAGRWPINKDGLISLSPENFLNNTSRTNLTHSLFDNDAIILKNLQSHKVSLKSNMHSHGLDFYFQGFPYLGLWSAKGGDFLCIEPWCGIADPVDSNQQLVDKEGIQSLEINDSWKRQWQVCLF